MMNELVNYPPLEEPEIGDGTATEVAEGIFWLRMPMGGSIGAINLWALADGDGWTIVDTGLRTTETSAAWRRAFASTLGGRPVRRIIVTHLHPDHSGMAGWLAQKQPARLWMTRLEYLTLRVLASYTGQEAPEEAIRFYRTAGWDEDALDHYRARFGDFGKMLYPLPASFHALDDGQRIMIGDREWVVVIGKGHSPEHALLHCPEAKLLISGDQVLPQISSNVSVQPLQPEADPLTEWLETLDAVRRRVPDDVLVLPSHGKPFHGLHGRIQALIDGHEVALVRLLEFLETPSRAIDVFPALFKRQIDRRLLGLATGESLAHLACLRTRGLVSDEVDAGGIRWWRALEKESAPQTG
ncbi:Zinc metallohydrolase, glyoxalase II family [Sphingobium chlorophenolicum]|uniref:Zinc metallohydrolase, glyoxalase II family n=2 Tax=Sphingobium chlorophenolicum TaxID=46429 RepID=A0A081REB7_SPHCR|nr:MBL fold metallo-hydrolase [Sphingobium chlorophenolicum]KEQ53540.1 Zinc metallohydrolase, glyoxalase II family [Sphingobium chlorophenolicum]